METEQNPLLAPETAAEADHNLIYSRFSPRRKRTVVALVAWACFVPFFVSGSFIPAIPQVAKELGSDVSAVSWAISIMWFVGSFTGMTWATYAAFYGRRVVYLYSMPCLAVGSFGVSTSQSISELLFWRSVQAAGSSAGISTGMAIIGDIYKLEERGTAIGITSGALLIGPAVAPLVGGIVTEYYASWRLMQAGVGFAALLTYLLMYAGMPETSHPGTRGIDKEFGGKFKWVWLNPFKCLWYMRSPNLLALAFVGATSLLSEYVLLLPISTTFEERYGIHSKVLIGACFIPAGVGNLIGAPLSGRVSDLMIKKWRRKRAGKWVAEDRLRAALFGASWLPLSMVFFGLAHAYIGGTTGLAVVLGCLFIHGIGADIVMTPIIAYNVDVIHAHSAEVMSAHSGVRNVILAIALSFVVPANEWWGVLVTNSVAAGIMILGTLVLWATIRFGEEMRAYVDVGYSTIADT